MVLPLEKGVGDGAAARVGGVTGSVGGRRRCCTGKRRRCWKKKKPKARGSGRFCFFGEGAGGCVLLGLAGVEGGAGAGGGEMESWLEKWSGSSCWTRRRKWGGIWRIGCGLEKESSLWECLAAVGKRGREVEGKWKPRGGCVQPWFWPKNSTGRGGAAALLKKKKIKCFRVRFRALIDEKILCMHGGLSPDLRNLDQIRNLYRPAVVPETGLLCDLLWSDPSKDIQGWGANDRGVSYIFGADRVTEFLQKHDLDLICRAHQVVEDGYEFFANRQLVTIFSAPNYCGEFDNAGAMMSVDENLLCSFQILRPAEKKPKFGFGSTGTAKNGTIPPKIKSFLGGKV